MAESIVIVSAARTPMGAFQGDFSALSAHDLGGVAIKAAIERAAISPEVVGSANRVRVIVVAVGISPSIGS